MDENNKKSSIVEVLPETYKFPRLSEFKPKLQRNNGLCWAYATLGCVEFKLIQQDSFLDPKRLDFSRVHMEYSCFDLFPKEEQSWGIKANISHGPKFYQFLPVIEAYLSRHSGPVYEFAEPTPEDESREYRTFKQIELDPIKPYFVSDFGVVDTHYSDKERIEEIKRAVMNHGAVFANIEYDLRYFKDNLYYAITEREINLKEVGGHAVMIVGWDDTIKKSSFYNSKKIKRDGAFLIRDSAIQGPINNGRNYWISYGDKFITDTNCYIKSVDRWYDEYRMYQNNYFGTYMAKNLAKLYDTPKVCFLVRYKREDCSEREVIRSVLLFNVTRETDVEVVLVRSDKTEEVLIPELCMEDVGYGTYHVNAKDEKGNLKDVFLEVGEKEFYLKVTYSRNSQFDVPMEMSNSLREEIGNRVREVSENEQFLFVNGEFQDTSKGRYKHSTARLGVKLITEPASETWSRLKNYVDSYVVDEIISPVAHNLKTDSPFSVSWEAIREDNGEPMEGIRILQDTLVNETSEDKQFVLHGRFTVTGDNQREYKINRFYYTGIKKANVTLEPIQSPEKGEYRFVAKGKSTYPNTTVNIIACQMENANALALENDEIVIGSGVSDENGTFQIHCSYIGVGKISVVAKIQELVSNRQIVEIKKNYTESEEEVDTGSGEKKKKKKYHPENGLGLGQVLKEVIKGIIIGAAVTEIYIYCSEYYYVTRGMLPADEIPLLNVHMIHRHLDAILENEDEAAKDPLKNKEGKPGTIFFEKDVAGVRRLFKSLQNCSFEGVTFSMPSGMGLMGAMDKDSFIKDSKFIVRDEGECEYFPIVDSINGGKIENVDFDVSVMKDKAESFPGFAGLCEGGKFVNCRCQLNGGQDGKIMQVKNEFAGFIGSASNVEISDCTFTGNVSAGGNASGLVGNAMKTTVSGCYINASLKGLSASGITSYAGSQLSVSKCMVDGKLVATNSAGSVCAGFRAFEPDKISSINNCICRMDIEIEENEKGMIGYAGGIVGIGGNCECGLEIENCLVLGTISCGMDSWIAGVVASAKSCKNTVAVLDGVKAGQESAQVSVFGDCLVENSLCYDQIESISGYLKGPGSVDGQVLARKKTYVDLGWDFENIWNFSGEGFPYLRNMEGRINEWPFPFVRLTGLKEDGSLEFKANTQISFSGIYGKEMSGIGFQSCTLQGKELEIVKAEKLGNLKATQEFTLNFGMLSETGVYQFTLKYKRGERVHTVTLPVIITN